MIAEQCGDEIAVVLDGLADLLRNAAGCPTSRLRSTAHLKRRGIIRIEELILHAMHIIEIISSRGNKL